MGGHGSSGNGADLGGQLRDVLDELAARYPGHVLAAATARLITAYRDGNADHTPPLRSDADVAAYATYRMPATLAAVRAAFAQVAVRLPDFQPRGHLDLGGGTGAAVWAAAELWPSIESARVLDRAPAMLAAGRALAAAGPESIRHAEWQEHQLGVGVPLPPADLATLSYVLGELPPEQRDGVIDRAASAATTLVVVEPGTRGGYERILAARDRLIRTGLTVVAPCPHHQACPLADRRDWCHFGVRLGRSPAHRHAKGGALGYEDEKFSYVAATRAPATPQDGSRVLRRPSIRKGLVALRLCQADGTVADTVVSKRQGDRYRAARDLRWGDIWL